MFKSLALRVDKVPKEDPNETETRRRFDYEWLPLELVVRWDKVSKTMLAVVFQACPSMRQRIGGITDQTVSPPFLSSPFGLHIFLLEELLNLYDNSFWRLRKNLRQVESVSLVYTHSHPPYHFRFQTKITPCTNADEIYPSIVSSPGPHPSARLPAHSWPRSPCNTPRWERRDRNWYSWNAERVSPDMLQAWFKRAQ